MQMFSLITRLATGRSQTVLDSKRSGSARLQGRSQDGPGAAAKTQHAAE